MSCQKPLAPTLADARAMLAACEQSENWRWQTPLRELRTVLDTAEIGRIFRARVTYSNSYPVFDNQPSLKDLDQFILTDVGTHIQRCPSPNYPWVDPRYALELTAGVACNAKLLAALQAKQPAETTAADNLKTLELVFAAYDSAARQASIRLAEPEEVVTNRLPVSSGMTQKKVLENGS